MQLDGVPVHDLPETERTRLRLQHIGIVTQRIDLMPALIVADEPTGSLDTNTGDHVLGLLQTVARREIAVIIATHDPRASAHADRTIRLVDGRVVSVAPR